MLGPGSGVGYSCLTQPVCGPATKRDTTHCTDWKRPGREIGVSGRFSGGIGRSDEQANTSFAAQLCANQRKGRLSHPAPPAISGSISTKNVSISRRQIESSNRPGNYPKYNAHGPFPNDNESASYPAPTLSSLATSLGSVSSAAPQVLRKSGCVQIVHFVTVIFFPYLTHLHSRC